MSQLTINSQVLKRMVNLTAFAAARDDSRPVLAGLFIEAEGETVSFAGCDGFRMAIANAPIAKRKERFTAIVPRAALVGLAKSIGKKDAPITLTKNEHTIAWGDGSSRLIDGTYPSVKQLIPTSIKTVATLPRDEFLAATKRAAVFAHWNNDVLRFDLRKDDTNGDHVRVSADAAEVGWVYTDLHDGLQLEGPSGHIAFNVGYIQDMLVAYDTEQVAFRFIGPNNAGVFTPVGVDALCVAMPMHEAR